MFVSLYVVFLKRSDAVSDLLRGGLRTHCTAVDKATDSIYTSFEETKGVIECVHEPARHRSVLVFIKARESTHFSAPGLACVAWWATCCFLHHFQPRCFQRKIRTRPDCWVIGRERLRLPMIPSHSSHLTGYPLRPVSYRQEWELYECMYANVHLHSCACVCAATLTEKQEARMQKKVACRFSLLPNSALDFLFHS